MTTPDLTEETIARLWAVARAQGVGRLSDIDIRGLDDLEVRQELVAMRSNRIAFGSFLRGEDPDPLTTPENRQLLEALLDLDGSNPA